MERIGGTDFFTLTGYSERRISGFTCPFVHRLLKNKTFLANDFVLQWMKICFLTYLFKMLHESVQENGGRSLRNDRLKTADDGFSAFGLV